LQMVDTDDEVIRIMCRGIHRVKGPAIVMRSRAVVTCGKS
jgi:hypothetical protein